MTRPDHLDHGGRIVRLLDRAYDDPVVQLLVAETQQVYRERYGGPDETPIKAAEFTPPNGLFVLAYLGDEPAAIGGWRRRTGDPSTPLPGRHPAEIKRMFVRTHLRGLGLARAVLAHLESTAAAAGIDQLVLETGSRQPEAISLYQSSGYTPIAAFGIYAEEDGVVNLGKRLVPSSAQDPALQPAHRDPNG